jgi:hypothetical protein
LLVVKGWDRFYTLNHEFCESRNIDANRCLWIIEFSIQQD